MSRPNFETILATVADWSGIAPSALCGDDRHARAVIARGVLIVAAYEFGTMSYPEIRNAMVEYRSASKPLSEPVRGNPRHSTAITSASRTRQILLAAERKLLDEISGGAA